MGDVTLSIRYFGGVRQLTSGARTEELTVDAPCQVEELMDLLCETYPSLARIRAHVRIAVNEAFADSDATLTDGDTVALIPPVAGGQQTLCRLTEEPLDAGALIDAVSGPSQGGLCVFIGTVRDHNEGRQVIRLEYEAYEEMVLSELAVIVERCEAVGHGVRVAVAHRVGSLEIGDAAVIVAASAPHRAEAFDACRLCIEQLKQDVPIFKRELGPDGAEWIGLRP